VPRPNAVLLTETLPEILSEKIRALLERRYLKGRDIFDLWYLRTVLNAAADKEMIERKFRMYAWPFQAARNLDFFADPSPEVRKELKTAIREDLFRFLPPEILAVHQAEGYASFLLQSQVVCTVLTLGTAVGSARNLEYGGVTIEFSHLAARLFTGFETRDGFNLALLEKALLDTIYLRKAIPFRDELDLDLLDKRRLDRLANDFPGQTRKLVHELICPVTP
jgi:hypothetical protein